MQGILACTGCRWTDRQFDELRSARAKLVSLSLLDGPISAEALRAALDLNKLSLYGILQTLSERGLVERTESGAYRARVLERDEDEDEVEDDRSDPLVSTE